MIRLLALHGFSLQIPDAWDVIINKGYWQGGHVVLAEGYHQVFTITWERSGRTPDLTATLKRAGKRLAKVAHLRLTGISALGKQGVLARYEGVSSICHAVALRLAEDSRLTLVLRQLSPGGSEQLLDLVASLREYRPPQPIPWRIHGIHVVLPFTWRLEGLMQVVGFERAFWFRYPDPAKPNRVDGALVIRRYACGLDMLRGHAGLGAWMRTNLGRRETVLEETATADGACHLRCQSPGASLWDRLRRRTRERHLDAWIEGGSDRLVVQEFKGFGPPPPPLRCETAAKDAPVLG